jgi:hypothetical protein
MTYTKGLLVSEKRREIVAIFERLLEACNEGEISREKAADTIVNVIDALRNKEPMDDEHWYEDLLYLLAILGLC